MERDTSSTSVLRRLIEDLIAIDGVDAMAILDDDGLTIECSPDGPAVEKMASSISTLLEDTADMLQQDSSGQLTLLAQDGCISVIPMKAGRHLLIRSVKDANLGRIRQQAGPITARIDELL